jgi:predicted nucleotidyltransferase
LFTPEERERLRQELIETARADPRISGVALTGSAAGGREDRWSDIDLAFGVSEEAGVQATMADWSQRMYDRHRCLHHLDVPVGDTIYRVFFLASTLQVDLAFSPEREFGARAPTFKLLSGRSVERPKAVPPDQETLIGLGWLYAIHARSSIARGRWWQAEYMIHTVRDKVLALACLRSGLPAVEGRGFDRLPPEVLEPLRAALVEGPEPGALVRALAAVLRALTAEICSFDERLGARLRPALEELEELAATGGGDEGG